MPLALRVAQSLSEAAGILAADPGARLLSGGTLVMRDVNEGRLTRAPCCASPIRPGVRCRSPATGSSLARASPWP